MEQEKDFKGFVLGNVEIGIDNSPYRYRYTDNDILRFEYSGRLEDLVRFNDAVKKWKELMDRLSPLAIAYTGENLTVRLPYADSDRGMVIIKPSQGGRIVKVSDIRDCIDDRLRETESYVDPLFSSFYEGELDFNLKLKKEGEEEIWGILRFYLNNDGKL